MQRDSAPVIAAEMLLRRGFSDDRVRAHLLRLWLLDEAQCQATLDAAHILLRRDQRNIGESSDRADDS